MPRIRQWFRGIFFGITRNPGKLQPTISMRFVETDLLNDYFWFENFRASASMLNTDEQKELVEIAWDSIRRAVVGKRAEPTAGTPKAHGEESPLSWHMGVFVTLYKKKDLRGCLGLIASDEPLSESVAQMAGRSATEDPRFPPVSEVELADIRIEISVLSPLKEISSIEEIHVGTHGIFLTAGMHRGLLLPQVAATHHWDRIQFLEETCIKAGLPRDQWKHAESRIYIFSAEIIEQELL